MAAERSRTWRWPLAAVAVTALLAASAVLTPNLWLAPALAAWLSLRFDAGEVELEIGTVSWRHMDVRTIQLIQPQQPWLERISGRSLRLDWAWRHGRPVPVGVSLQRLQLDLNPQWQAGAQGWLRSPQRLETWFQAQTARHLPDIDVEQLELHDGQGDARSLFRLHLRDEPPVTRLFLAGSIGSLPFRSQLIAGSDLFSLAIETEGTAMTPPGPVLALGPMQDDPRPDRTAARGIPQTVLAVAGYRDADGRVEGSLQADPGQVGRLLTALGLSTAADNPEETVREQGLSVRWQTAPGSATIRIQSGQDSVALATPAAVLGWIRGMGPTRPAEPEHDAPQ